MASTQDYIKICCFICLELLRILMRDAKDFDTLVWFYAVGVVMTAMVILGLTVCILLVRDCYEDDGLAGKLKYTHVVFDNVKQYKLLDDN